MQRQIPFLKLTFFICPKETINLPVYKGSAFRGGFGYAFKRIVCALKKETCDECLLKYKCIYAYVFETISDYKIKRIPHPFVIEPPLVKKQIFEGGEEICFSLILFGKAIDYVPYFIYAFEELGNIGIGKKRGKFIVKRIEGAKNHKQNDSKIIYSDEEKILYSYEHSVLDLNGVDGEEINEITLNFLTPTRIVYQNKLTIDLQFHILMRSLLRRISEICFCHCNGEYDKRDFKKMIERAKNIKILEKNLFWYDWERYSARQDARMKLGGFIGSITFIGSLTEFIQYIKAGEILHIGKNTSFGLGKYEIFGNVSF